MLTPSAQNLVQRHKIGQKGEADADQVLLGAVKGTLGVEDVQIAVAPFFIACLRHPIREDYAPHSRLQSQERSQQNHHVLRPRD